MDVFSDEFWQNEFDITIEDLDRIENRMLEEARPFTLSETVKRIIRGRLLYGPVDSNAVLPKVLENQRDIRLWDPAGIWETGDKIILTSGYTNGPQIGVVVGTDKKQVEIRVDGVDRLLTFNRAKTGSKDAEDWYQYQRKSLTEKYRSDNIDDRIDGVFEKHPRVSTRVSHALYRDERFTEWNNKIFLDEHCISLDFEQINQLYQKMLAETKAYPVTELVVWIPEIPQNEVGVFSLYRILSNDPVRFAQQDDLWMALKPPPPPWDQAEGSCYFYEPKTYEVILIPGQRLTKKVADRLEELGCYAEVVTDHAT